MRLQSAIFTLGDTLFTPDGAAREGLDKALSLFKMEGVWLGAVTALSAEDAQKALEKAGLNSYFRFVLTESVALCKADSGTMFERAMKRLHSQKDDTIVFSGSLSAIQNAKDAGFRTVAVQGSAGAADWSTMQQLATQSLAQYSELLSDSV
ncbi:HAD hydrolase-like protein [Oscillospiraceae bacterium HCN-4035]|jgi:beta-phosphoglucomutase-like phosphatase (HAD superfamily)